MSSSARMDCIITFKILFKILGTLTDKRLEILLLNYLTNNNVSLTKRVEKSCKKAARELKKDREVEPV